MGFEDLTKTFGDRFATIRGRLRANVPLAPITWFRVGGPAQLLFTPADEDDLSAFLSVLPRDIPVLPIGLASNLLIRDGGIPGVVIRLSAKGFGQIDNLDDGRLRIGAAVPDKRAAAAALEARLGGFEFYHGIPGAIGGALRMNAGANGMETRERVVEVRAVTRDGEFKTFTNAEMGYSYRHSDAPADVIFTSAVFAGDFKPEAEIQAAMNAVQEHREKAQPIRTRTGGSTFKNPPGSSAWKLVDEAGCRGLRVGGAEMSRMHCNFMINTGAATAHDLEMLGETVRRRVRDHSGIELEWEIKRIGRFEPGREIHAILGDES